MQRRSLFSTLVTAITISTLSWASFAFTPQKYTAKTPAELEQYFESGAYLKEIETKVLQAKDYVDRRVMTSASAEKFAMILDIDETALSNYSTLKQNHFSTNKEAFTAAYLVGKPDTIGPVLGLYQYAKHRGIAVFFISNRPNTPEIMDATVRSLKQAGFSDWHALYLKPIQDDALSTEAFKQQTRQKILDEGYSILVNLGDQQADLAGGASEVAIQLPNPFYAN